MRSVVRAALRVLLVWVSLGAAVEAQSTDDAVARKLFEAGKVAYEAGDYEDALRFFEQAHERSARPGLLFNIAQAADRLREDERALAAYRAYLTQVPEADNRPAVEARIRAMERVQQRERPSVAEPVVAPTPEATARAATPTVETTSAPDAATDQADDDGGVVTRWWFWTAIGVVVVGGVVAFAALSSEQPQPMLVQGDVEGVVTTLQAGN